MKEKDNCCALILAAGYSRRMKGRLKPLLNVGNNTFLEEIGEKLQRADIKDIYVVIGHRAEEVKKAHVSDSSFRWVYNSDYPAGQFSSLQAGVQQIKNSEKKYSGILYQPVDIPMISLKTYQTLLRVFHSRNSLIIKPLYKQKTGHPVIFPFKLIPSILAQPIDTITSRVFEKDNHPVSVPDPYVLKDFDFLEDYNKMD